MGEFTFRDLVSELAKPGRDPREEFTPFCFREDLFELKDLQVGFICPGIVTNVTNFGVFVDVGVHQDGLVHISQLSDRFVKDPRSLVSPGDHVQVKVLELNLEKKQISFTMKGLPGNPGYLEKPQPAARSPRPPKQQQNREDVRPQQQPRAAMPQPPKIVGNYRPGAGTKVPPRPQQKQVFNNAFAGLAALKSTLKK